MSEPSYQSPTLTWTLPYDGVAYVLCQTHHLPRYGVQLCFRTWALIVILDCSSKTLSAWYGWTGGTQQAHGQSTWNVHSSHKHCHCVTLQLWCCPPGKTVPGGVESVRFYLHTAGGPPNLSCYITTSTLVDRYVVPQHLTS